MDIVHLTAPARVGGLETVVAALASGTARRGHRVRVYALLEDRSDARCDPFSRLAEAGAALVEVRLPPRSYRAEVRRLVADWRGAPPDLIHAHGYHADLVAWRAARHTRTPVVTTVHGFTGGDLKNRLYERLDRWAMRRFAAVVAVSAPLRSELAGRGIPPDRIHLIPNAWRPGDDLLPRGEARRRLGLPAAGAIVGWVGRLNREKGADVMVEALGRTNPDLALSFLGEGPLESRLRARAAELGLSDRIRWHGLVPNAATILRAFDAVVLTSRTEGTPMILLEAMAASVPVIATRVGGIPDVASDHEALLVPPEDPGAVAAALDRLRSDPAATAARVEAAAARVAAGYDVDRWLDRHEVLYRSVTCR